MVDGWCGAAVATAQRMPEALSCHGPEDAVSAACRTQPQRLAPSSLSERMCQEPVARGPDGFSHVEEQQENFSCPKAAA